MDACAYEILSIIDLQLPRVPLRRLLRTDAHARVPAHLHLGAQADSGRRHKRRIRPEEHVRQPAAARGVLCAQKVVSPLAPAFHARQRDHCF